MSKIGKIDLENFEKFLLHRLGHPNKNVLVPPMTGVDAGVIDLGNDKVLIIAEDPIFPLPNQSLDTFGWYVVYKIVHPPEYAILSISPWIHSAGMWSISVRPMWR
jgi:hydrogenase expression/formation protein HypE